MADQFLTREVSRRDFNAASLTALFVGMSVWVGACGKSGSDASPVAPTSTTTSGTSGTGTSTVSDKAGTISSNHGHAATVTGVQLQAGGAVTLHIQGTAGHDHTVNLSASEVGQIAGGTRATMESSTDSGHSHSVTFN